MIGPQRPPARVPLTHDVVEDVRRMVLDGTLRPGDRLPSEKDLAVHLGVSRGSLREGVRALAALGILQARHGDGTYVTELDATRLVAPLAFLGDMPGDRTDVLAVRRTLETEAAALAARHSSPALLEQARASLDDMAGAFAEPVLDAARVAAADVAFHRTVAEASGNRVLAALVDALAAPRARERAWRDLHEDTATRVVGEHAAILDALTDADPDRARILMAAHLIGAERILTAHGAAPA